jgi:hypothetical protein
MPTIPLTQGKEAIVCDCHFNLIKDKRWRFAGGAGDYAVTADYSTGKHKTVYMHKVIKPSEIGMDVDHKDLNPLNNSCDNLRVCTRSQNRANTRLQRNNTSGYKGVYPLPEKNKWAAQIKVNGTKMYLGRFTSKVEAAKAYNKAAKLHFGEFALLNRVGA